MKTKFISFYCDRDGGDYYSSCAKKIKSRLDELGASHDIREIPSQDHYMLNCLEKPKFILDMLNELDESLIWIDIDCTINQLPEELDAVETDVGFAIREHDLKTPHSALIFFNNTEKSKEFIRDWIKKCDSKKKDSISGKYTLGDHEQLILAAKENKPQATFTAFPPSLCAVETDVSKVSIGLSYGENECNKIQAFYPPFSLKDGSSCGKLKPRFFKWTDRDCKIQVFVDNGMGSIPSHPREKGTYRFGWLCESKEIVNQLYLALKSKHEIFFDHFDGIFTCDEELLQLDSRFMFALSGSNLPWTPREDFGVHEKNKLCSLLASPKQMTKGHQLRYEWADNLKNDIDVFGGVSGSSKIGTDGYASASHPPKTEALKDYMFSITIENASYNHYFTEKITDCFANGTIPVYWGCPNIGQYFNEDGIIVLNDSFDIKDLNEELYNSKIDAVKENYEKIKTMKLSDDILWEMISQYIDKAENK
jgi:hypothetical protein